jgi:hypothetical protein
MTNTNVICVQVMVTFHSINVLIVSMKGVRITFLTVDAKGKKEITLFTIDMTIQYRNF